MSMSMGGPISGPMVAAALADAECDIEYATSLLCGAQRLIEGLSHLKPWSQPLW